MVEFTKAAADAMENNTAPELVKKWTEKRNELILKVRGEIEEEERTKAVTMMTLLQEQIYTAKGLPDNWANEVKYEQVEDNYVAKCGEHTIQLGSNFPAGQLRLVVTPLTRICRQKIFEGAATGKIVHFYGPAGTGKTETMKDTLKDMGYDVTVVSVSGSTTAEQLKESISEGKPVVFDEFTRLPEATIKEFIDLMPKEKPAIGITCNPGAEGTTELPEELKSQCISLEMKVPDYELIVEIMLFSMGFLEGDAMGAKLVTAINAAREKFSKQPHYDLGMRKLKQLTQECGFKGQAEEYKDENLIVANAVFTSLFDMATQADRAVLKDIVKESFGTEVTPPTDATEGDRWTKTTAALGRAMKARHGSMIVNVSKEDEEACISAVTEAGKVAETSVLRMPGTMNVSRDEFIGKQTGPEDWSEGAFTTALREAIAKKAWLVVVCGEDLTKEAAASNFGPLHPVLDANKMLTLETGEKIPLCDAKIVFIAKDGSAMAPADVSRLGAIWSE